MGLLQGYQWEELTEALLDAFPDPHRFQQMLKFRLNKHLAAIAPMGADLTTIIFEVIQRAESEGWTIKFIEAARQSNPGNEALRSFAEQDSIGLAMPVPDNLERTVSSIEYLDMAEWGAKLGQIETQVCRIEIKLHGGQYKSFGTGFLVGPDLVLTNYHVMEPVINREELQQSGGQWARPEDVTLLFDHKKLPGGRIINPGTPHQLARGGEKWLVDYSPLSPLDNLPEERKGGDPDPDHLDYALIRLQQEIGKRAIGFKAEPGSPKRGWVTLSSAMPHFQTNDPLIIVQHPDHEPLKLAFDTQAIIGLNSNQTRVTYRTNTEKGSSGAPCFDLHWNLIAIHHAGDPNYAFPAKYNQGIPIEAIVNQLQRKKIKIDY